ncbi:MAG: branched-chain amino acid aminotransferase [Alphaproteobacteria bacterium]
MTLVPYDDRDGFMWFNGALSPWRDVKLHVLSHALHYASCVFEGERVYAGRVFKLTEHSERLHRSAEMLDFKIPYTVEEIDAATREVVQTMDITDGYVRPVAWRGSEMMGVSAQQTRVHVAIAAWPWPPYFGDEGRMRGIRLQISSWRRPSPETAPTGSKAAGLYMICTLARHKAEAAGFDDALMLDWRGRVAETTGANFFIATNGELHTPIPDCFLDGITRRTVMGLARARGIKVVERVIMPSELAEADEVFITGTAAEVTPVREIDDHDYQVGTITRRMVEDYDAEVRKPEAGSEERSPA